MILQSLWGVSESLAEGVNAQTSGGMWSLVLYILAVIAGLTIIWFYEPRDESKNPEVDVEVVRPRYTNRYKADFRLSSLWAVLGLDVRDNSHFEAFTEHFHTLDELSHACRRAGLEHSNLIIGVDFTASNEWQGRKSFNQNCLHKTQGNKVYNPYQKTIAILGQTLKPFDEDNDIPAYGFGDAETTDEEVFPFSDDDTPCHGFEEVLQRYNDIAKRVTLSGPTSFAPIITRAMQIVRRLKTYHILVIIADGQVNEEKPTIEAIVEASKLPISIIVVGVGDGPWEVMEEFDHRLPKRIFDNFRFVDYHKTTFKSKNPDMSFALQALMEIPDQYKMIKSLGYLDIEGDAAPGSSMAKESDSAASSPRHSTPRDTPKSSPSPKRSFFGSGKRKNSTDGSLRNRVGSGSYSTCV